MEESKLSSVLWVVFSIITLSLILYFQTGLWLTLEFFIVSSLAVICWVTFSFKQQQSANSAVPRYILSVIGFLTLCTTRYAAHFWEFIDNYYHSFFRTAFIMSSVNWFILFVCLPVALMLAGGYFLAKRLFIGSFFAWWAFLFCFAESLVQLKIELANINSYRHIYFSGFIMAMGLFLLCGYSMLKLIKPDDEQVLVSAFPSPPTRKINLWSVLFISLVILYGITLYSQAGLLPVGVIAGAMMGGMIGWRKTTARFPADPFKLVPLYLLLQALFYFHVGEETITHFNQGIASISGHPWSDASNMYVIAFAGPVVWIFAAWSLWKGQAFGNFILWFMIVGMIMGEPTHLLVFPVVRMIQQGVPYEYFSGMYTALFPMIPAILALRIILKEHKARKLANA